MHEHRHDGSQPNGFSISGPFEESDGLFAAPQSGCVPMGPINFSLDGVEMDPSLGGLLSSVGGGPTTGGSPSIDWQHSTICPTFACQPTVPGHDGYPKVYSPEYVIYGNVCAGLVGAPKKCADQGRWEWVAGPDSATGATPAALQVTFAEIAGINPGPVVGPLTGPAPLVPPVESACSEYMQSGTGAGEALNFLCMHLTVPAKWSDCVRGGLLSESPFAQQPGSLAFDFRYLLWDHSRYFAKCAF